MRRSSTVFQLLSCTGILGSIALALSGWGYLSALASFTAPFIWALSLEKASARQAALSSITFGFCGWLIGAWWLSTGISAMNASYWWAGLASLFLLASLAALPYLIFGYLSYRMKLLSHEVPRPLCAAALISLAVELSPNPLPGSLVNGVSDLNWFVQILDLGGTPLVHFALYSISFLAAASLRKPRSRKATVLCLSRAVTILSLIYGYACFQRQHWADRMAQSRSLNVGIVQPNIPIKDGLNFGSAGSLASLGDQTKSLLQSDSPPDLIVWPEIPIYFSPFNAPQDQRFLNELLRGHDTPLLVSADMFANERRYGRIPFYNVVQLVQGSAEILGQYQKMLLVPMGEYLPFEEFLEGEYFRSFLRDVRRYAPGREISLMRTASGLAIATPICLEILHSEHVGNMVRSGAQIIVNPSNDGYFGQTPGARLNFSYARLRSIEFRLPLVRVTNTGISAAIDQLGEIIPGSLLPEFEPASTVVSVHPFLPSISYLQPRAWGIITLALVALFTLLRIIFRLNPDSPI